MTSGANIDLYDQQYRTFHDLYAPLWIWVQFIGGLFYCFREESLLKNKISTNGLRSKAGHVFLLILYRDHETDTVEFAR
jgi:hypothetical protein